MESDSLGYLAFAPARTAGYPLVLRLFGADGAVSAQMLLYGTAALALALAVNRLTGSALFAALLLLAQYANPEVDRFHWTLLTESLFMSLDELVLAAWVMALATRRSGWAVAAVIAAALATTVRPSAAALLAIALLVCAVHGQRRARTTLLATVLAGLIIGGERAYSVHVHGARLTSLASPHLFAKAGLIDAPPSGRTDRLAVMLEQDNAPVRTLLREARGTSSYSPLLSIYEVCLQWSCREARDGGANDAALRRAAVDRLAANPAAFARLAIDEYRGLWVFGDRTHPELGPAFDRFVAAHRPLPFADMVAEASRPAGTRASMWLARPLFALVGGLLAGAMLAGALWARRSTIAAAVFLAAVSAQASLVLTAVVAIGYARYTMALWPNLVLAMGLASFALLRAIPSPQVLRIRPGSLDGRPPRRWLDGAPAT